MGDGSELAWWVMGMGWVMGIGCAIGMGCVMGVDKEEGVQLKEVVGLVGEPSEVLPRTIGDGVKKRGGER